MARRESWLGGLWAPGVAGALIVVAAGPGAAQQRSRNELEADSGRARVAFEATPRDGEARKQLARSLFELGAIARAREIVAPLVGPTARDTAALSLAARGTLLLGDYPAAERLFRRLAQVAPKGSKLATAAVEGLVMTYYQTNRYDKARTLALPDAISDDRGTSNLLTFMKKFPGTPYRVEWASASRTAELPIVNDFAPGGALPEMELEINGQKVRFILDTGGDRLYIDRGVAERLGLTKVWRRRSRYAYTKGEYVDEPLAVADRVRMGSVTVRNVPVIVAKWKELGLTTDGVVTTQLLKQFLSTVDYDAKRIVFRERTATARAALMAELGAAPVEVPFVMADTHLMFSQGTLNGRSGLNLLLDSGLALSAPIVLIDETVKVLGLTTAPVPSAPYYVANLSSHGIGSLIRGPTQAVGHVIVEENAYWSNGFLWDGLISHQYLRHLGSWTIDFDAMRYYFPASAARSSGAPES